MRNTIKTLRISSKAIFGFCSPQKQNLYKLLEVSPDASFQQIKQCYLEKSKFHHPDSPTGNQQSFVSIQEAYKVLSDGAKRKRYDKSLGIQYSLWDQQDFGLKNSNFQNQEEFERILSKKSAKSSQIKSTRDLLFERLERQPEKSQKQSYSGLILPGFLFIGFWMLWETAETVLIGYKGEKKYEAKISEQGKNFSSFAAEIR